MPNMKRILAAAILCTGTTVLATDFLTEGVDAERTGWVKDEKIFTPANVGSSKLLWKIKLESTPRAMHNLFAPLIAERVTTAQGTRELGVVAGVTDDLFGIDIATGQQIWHTHFDNTLENTRPSTDTLCPADRPRCQRSRRSPLASTRSMRSRGTGACGKSISQTARMWRPRKSSCPAAASRTH